MTAPATTDRTAPPTPSGRRPRLPRVPTSTAAQDWRCENCAEQNSARRRRCHDCGTTRA